MKQVTYNESSNDESILWRHCKDCFCKPVIELISKYDDVQIELTEKDVEEMLESFGYEVLKFRTDDIIIYPQPVDSPRYPPTATGVRCSWTYNK